MDAIYGVTMEKMAELNAKYSELKTQYGERDGQTAFERFLGGQGLDMNTFAHAWNGWWTRFSADPTGRLQASYHQIEQQLLLKAHFGDVPDMSQYVKEGATLEQYVKTAIQMGQPGVDHEQVARQNGLDGLAHWQRVNAAWTAAMANDPSHRISTQYGLLYQKHAGAGFQQQMFEATAGLAAAAHRQEHDDAPPAEVTPEEYLLKLRSSKRRERWNAARRLAHLYDLGRQERYLACVPVLIEILENDDDDTSSDAEDAARKLLDIGQKTDDVKYAITVRLNRARERLETLQAAFAPIQHKAVPERVTLQSRIQDFTSLIESFEAHLSDWE